MKLYDLVKKLQAAMNEHGENLKIDGQFGPKTSEALFKYEVELKATPNFDDEQTVKIPPEEKSRDLAPAVSIIKEFEGLYLKAYLDPVGIPTIGWGTIKYPNGEKVKMGDTVTAAQAEAYLIHEMSGFVKSVEKLVKVAISNNSFCALVSFCYNLGAGALEKSTLLKRLNSGESKEAVAPEFMKWVNAGGKPLKGLVRRREAEKKLFLS